MARRVTGEQGLAESKPKHWDVHIASTRVTRSSIRLVVITSKIEKGHSTRLSITIINKDQAFCTTPESEDWAQVNSFVNDFQTGRKEIYTRNEKIGRSEFSVTTVRRAGKEED